MHPQRVALRSQIAHLEQQLVPSGKGWQLCRNSVLVLPILNLYALSLALCPLTSDPLLIDDSKRHKKIQKASHNRSHRSCPAMKLSKSASASTGLVFGTS